MTSERGAAGKSTFGTFLASPWTAVVSVVVALVIIAAGIVAVKNHNSTPAAPVAAVWGDTAPSDFTFDLQVASEPMVERGQTVSLTLAGPTDDDVQRVELWQDGELVYQLDDTESVKGGQTGQVRFAMDVVNMSAGGHLFIARAYDADGNMAQSQPLSLPTMDLPEDLGTFVATDVNGKGVFPGFSLASAPGDTLASVGRRLGVDPKLLAAGNGAVDPAEPLPSGTQIKGMVPPADELIKTAWDSPVDTDIKAVLDGCEVVVTSSTPGDLRVYGGAGMVALGNLPQGGELRLTNLPIGPTILAAYAPEGADPKVPPSIPITVTIPDECARDGWIGDAYINGGIMLADYSVSQAYVYLAVDKGKWQRIPQKDGAYLNGASTTMADLRQYVNLDNYDQLDLEVWSGGTGEGPVATGHYCRADSSHTQTGGSSASGGECTPKGATTPGAPGSAPPASLTINAQAVPIAGKPVDANTFNMGVQVAPLPPGIAFEANQFSSADVQFSTNAKELGLPGEVFYQFSYLPLTAGSTGANLPGIFYTAPSNNKGQVTINPWKWHAAKVTPESIDDVDHLSLTDEIAWGIAHQRLLEGRSLVDTIYVRAVTMNRVGDKLVYAGAASAAGLIEMPPAFSGDFPTIDDPKLIIREGRELPKLPNLPTTGAAGEATTPREPCVQVVKYPEPNVYQMYPGSMSYEGPDGKTYSYPGVNDQGYTPIFNSGMSDLNVATQMWPSDKYIYCQDFQAGLKREAAQNAANREKAECGIGCVFSMVVFGAMQGFLLGGPYGALVGIAAGLAVGIASALDPNFYALVTAAWDAIASVYNGVFTAVWKVVDAVNPVCQIAGAASSKAQSVCNDGFHAVGSAVYTYYTGIPPSLPDSKAALALAEGDLNAFVYAQIDLLLKELGLSCDTFTIPTSTLKTVNEQAGSKGIDTSGVKVVLDKDGNISGCAAVAGVFSKAVSKMAEQRQVQIMGDVTGKMPIPGLVLGLVGNEQPTLVITAPRDQKLSKGTDMQCPFVANIEVTENGETRRIVPVNGVMWSKSAFNPKTGVKSAGAWTGELAIPQSHASYSQTNGANWWTEPPSHNVREVVKAAGNAPYLRVQVDSPCFDVTQTVSVDEYTHFSSGLSLTPGAYYLDTRTVKTYW